MLPGSCFFGCWAPKGDRLWCAPSSCPLCTPAACASSPAGADSCSRKQVIHLGISQAVGSSQHVKCTASLSSAPSCCQTQPGPGGCTGECRRKFVRQRSSVLTWLCSTWGQLLCAPSADVMHTGGRMLPDEACARISLRPGKQCTATSLCSRNTSRRNAQHMIANQVVKAGMKQ